MSINRIIYGKSDINHIVGLEVDEDKVYIWTEKNGVVNKLERPNRFWLLSNEKIKPNWVRLEGDLHYKWGAQFKTREDFTKTRNFTRNYDTFSIWNAKEALMVKDGISYFKDLTIKEVSVLSFDIETTGIVKDSTSRVLLISNTFRDYTGKSISKLFAYDQYEDEGKMIDAWCNWVQEVNPAIILGHNVYFFDFPYLAHVASLHNTELKLGRENKSIVFDPYESSFRKDGSQSYSYHKCQIYGREIIDTMFLAIKYDVNRKYESYGLKAIIKHEGLEVKDRVFYDAGTIKDNFTNEIEWEKIKRYAERDAEDSLALFDLMGASFFYMTQSIPKPFQLVNESATGSQINSILVRNYLQDMHSIPKGDKAVEFQGGISLGIPGIYNNCIRWDAASMYPSVIRQYKITLGEKDPKNYFSELVEFFTLQRLKNKKLYKETNDKIYDDLQSSQKIFINSTFGFCGAPGLNFNSSEAAALITKHGREMLETVIKYTTGLNLNQLTNKEDNKDV